ncbi:MAG: TonB-dependent receptor [Bacteroidetes bacterium]|uniref:TonB-dependent receptor n=1 Tax=Candidatus Enterocola intestinipullorum TaxID=2840783 RepID=A0A9D9EHJ0_9BACT|nr:TonB-dependent receptor [Candidatus Enterocola intestinipullorum]
MILCVVCQQAKAGAGNTSVLDTVKVYDLEEFTFTPKRIRSEIVPYQHMDEQLLENMGCLSVADAVRYFSGVQLKDYGGVGGIKTLDIRSMGTNHMGVFYDGIQLNNAQNGQIDLGRFSLENMESVDLYNGQRGEPLQSAKDYGSAGTVYLRSKVPQFAKDETYHISAGIKGGSFGLINPSFYWQQKLSDSVSMSAGAEYTYATGRYKFRYTSYNPDGSLAYDTTAVRENADINAVRAEAGFFGKVKNGEWKAQVYNYYSERGLPGYIARNVFTHGQRQWDDAFFVQGSYKQTYFKRYSILANAKYAFDYTRYLNPDTTLQLVDNTYRQQEVYLSMAQSVKIFKFWDVSLSTDFQYNYLDASLRDFPYPSRYTGLVALATYFKFPNVKIQASVLGTFVHESVKANKAADDKAEFTPAVMVSVRPWATVPFDIRAFYKRVFRMPTFNDLYYTSIGSADLDPEYVNQYDVGISYQYLNSSGIFSGFDVQIDGYHNFVENKIVAIPASNPFRWQMKNYGKVSITGVDASMDFSFQWRRFWAANLRLVYGYQIAADLSYDKDSPYYGGQLPYTPWHSGSVIADISYKTLNLNYSFIYTGERYSSSANIPVNYVQPWYTHDLAISYGFAVKKVDMRVGVEVNNLLNQQYEVIVGYPMPGTNFKLTYKVSL